MKKNCRSTIHLGQSKKKRRRDRVSCAKVELPHNNLAKGDHISHEQEYNNRQSLMRYAEKYGVSCASRKYNKSRSYIYFWKQRWDGSAASLACQSRRPSRARPSRGPETLLFLPYLLFSGRFRKAACRPQSLFQQPTHEASSLAFSQ